MLNSLKRLLYFFVFAAGIMHAQAVQQVLPNPDCQIFFTLATSGASSPVLDNRQQGCTSWNMSYVNSGFSAVTVTLQSAANNAGVPATYSTGFPVQQTVVSGTNPGTSTTAGFVWLTGTNAFARVNLVATGSGVVNGALFGWRIPNAASQGGGGGAITCLTGDVAAGSGSGCTTATVQGLESVPFCSGFSPTNGQFVQYSTALSPNPCYTAAPAGGTIATTTNALVGDGAGNAVAASGTGTNCLLVNGGSQACSSGAGTGNAASVVTYTPGASVTLTCPSTSTGTVVTFDPGGTAVAANMALSFASCTTGQLVMVRIIQAASGGPFTVSGLPTGAPQMSTYPSSASVYLFQASSATAMNYLNVIATSGGSSLGSGASGISQTQTAGSSGVTSGLLAAKDTSNPSKYNTAAVGSCGDGVAAYTASAATFELYTVPGTVISMIADSAITAGDLVTAAVTTAGRVSDTGQTARTSVSMATCIVGTALASQGTAGNAVLVAYNGTGIYGGLASGGTHGTANFTISGSSIGTKIVTGCITNVAYTGTGQYTLTLSGCPTNYVALASIFNASGLTGAGAQFVVYSSTALEVYTTVPVSGATNVGQVFVLIP